MSSITWGGFHCAWTTHARRVTVTSIHQEGGYHTLNIHLCSSEHNIIHVKINSIPSLLNLHNTGVSFPYFPVL